MGWLGGSVSSTSDFGPGHDLMVHEFKPQCQDRPASDPLSPLSLPPHLKNKIIKNDNIMGIWVAQSVKCPTSAQVMISQFTSSGPTSGSVLIAQSLEPATDSAYTFAHTQNGTACCGFFLASSFL